MEYRNLGSSGVKVSTVCLGAMAFGIADEKSVMHGVSADEPTSHAILNRALEHGVNFVDTADVYGTDGLSEKIVGRWMATHETRNRIMLATKFRMTMGDGPNARGAARYRIVRTVEDSLRRLGTDRIDLYQIHAQDVDTPEEETLRALDDLVRHGKVVYLGASNYAAYRLTDSLWTSRTQNLEHFVSLQMQYSLVVRDLEREHVPLCRKFGLGIIPWSPLWGGFLTGKYARGAAAPAGTRLDKWKAMFKDFDSERNWRILDAVRAVAREQGSTPTAVSLAWLLHKPAVSSVIFGATTVAQLDENVKAAELALTDEQMKALDEASAFEVGYPYDFLTRLQPRW